MLEVVRLKDGVELCRREGEGERGGGGEREREKGEGRGEKERERQREGGRITDYKFTEG